MMTTMMTMTGHSNDRMMMRMISIIILMLILPFFIIAVVMTATKKKCSMVGLITVFMSKNGQIVPSDAFIDYHVRMWSWCWETALALARRDILISKNWQKKSLWIGPRYCQLSRSSPSVKRFVQPFKKIYTSIKQMIKQSNLLKEARTHVLWEDFPRRRKWYP